MTYPTPRGQTPQGAASSVLPMAPTSTPQTPFGRVLTAMVPPFTADGALDLDGAQRLPPALVGAGAAPASGGPRTRRPDHQRPHRRVPHHQRRGENGPRTSRTGGGRR